ncbi:hypothetical protein [Alkalicoccus daliensis]|uniref:Antitoxin VbhA domain-containing protein n=1 Tax=Alkalicoccus daliensis TaxID=745820 RepID=A0A1H0GW93_9BACI|nr:hypothetical protein [Alkalicoccus daliensis]SDO11052.1 hypothetical protein SAMN04488053_10759 [Alkalicoccus daliensis]
MTAKNIEIETALRSAQASLAVEGMTLTEKEEALVKERLAGNVSQESFLQRALELSRNE